MLLCIVVYCLSFVFCCCNKTIMETNMGRRGVYFTSWVTVHHWGKSAGIQSRILEAGTKADATEEHCLMACSPRLARPVFLHTPSCLSRGGTTHSWLDPSSVISVQENAPPQTCQQASPWRCLLSWGSLFLLIPACINLTKIKKHIGCSCFEKIKWLRKIKWDFTSLVHQRKRAAFFRNHLAPSFSLQSPTSFRQILELQDWIPVP